MCYTVSDLGALPTQMIDSLGGLFSGGSLVSLVHIDSTAMAVTRIVALQRHVLENRYWIEICSSANKIS